MLGLFNIYFIYVKLISNYERNDYMDTGTILTIVITGLIILALIFLTIGGTSLSKNRRIKRLSTEQTHGEVISYSFNNTLAPIVEYEVNGEKFKNRLKYTAVIQTSSTFGPVKSELKGDLLDTKLRIKGNTRVSVNTIMKDAFPLGSEMNVYYNPDRPKDSYVERYAKSYTGTIFIVAGILMVLALVILFIIPV